MLRTSRVKRMRATLGLFDGEFEKIRAQKALFLNNIFIQSKTIIWRVADL